MRSQSSELSFFNKAALKLCLYFWLVVFGLLYISFLIVEEDYLSPLLIVLSSMVPLIAPIYIINYFFGRLFMSKRQGLFVIIFVLMLMITKYLSEWWFYSVWGNTSMVSVSFLPLAFITSTVYIGIRYIQVALLQRMLLKEEEARRIRAEFMLLKSQVNPHFLFNALNSIYSLIISGSKLAAEATILLSELMRYQMETSLKSDAPLKEEMDFIRNYIELEKLRWQNKCNIDLVVTGSLEDQHIPPILLIPFVENCFKHGISVNSNTNFISVNIHVGQNYLEMLTRNNIAPKRPLAVEKSVSIGLENTQKRLDALYGDRYSLDITTEEAVFQVKLKIPL